jgi:hypothetical protein
MTEAAQGKNQRTPPDANEVRWRMEAAARYAAGNEISLVQAARELNEALEVIRQGSSDHRF